MDRTVALAQKLIGFATDIISQTEDDCSAFVAEILRNSGFEVSSYSFSPGRPSLVATKKGKRRSKLPLAFSGHLDVVPSGSTVWSTPPFEGVVRAGRLYGRGSCDMKAGVASFLTAAIEAGETSPLNEDLILIITAGEETGCEGAFDLVRRNVLPTLGALVVGEPTGNRPIIAHKGCLRVEVSVKGKGAHTSMPHLGKNAIETAARLIPQIADIASDKPTNGLLGPSTISISTMTAGSSINMVPDLALFTICARTIPTQSNRSLFDEIVGILGETAQAKILLDLPGIETDPDDWLVGLILGIVEAVCGERPIVLGAPYGTDAAALTPGTGNPPTVIIGPGQPTVAHQTNEYCDLQEIEQARSIYASIIARYNE